MQIEIHHHSKIELATCNFDEIIRLFQKVFLLIFGMYVHQILVAFAEDALRKCHPTFVCKKCGGTSFSWKTRHGKQTSILTLFGRVFYPELQIVCRCGSRQVISRQLLGVDRYARIPTQTIQKLGLVGALTTFRSARTIVNMFGTMVSRMTIWRCVQRTGEKIVFSVDPTASSIFEADGTGIPIQGVGKRGAELKVLLQQKKKGGCFVVGLSIGNYNSCWNKVFQPIQKQLSSLGSFLLLTDGDDSIWKGLGKKVDVVLQRCLWHIPHQFKYYGWKDSVSKKSELWKKAFRILLDIVKVKPIYACKDDKKAKQMLSQKKRKLKRFITFCLKQNWNACATYLKNAEPYMFNAVEKKIEGETTSHAERLMRTVNMRVNVGKWKKKSVLNAMKIRLAFFYNGWKPS